MNLTTNLMIQGQYSYYYYSIKTITRVRVIQDPYEKESDTIRDSERSKRFEEKRLLQRKINSRIIREVIDVPNHVLFDQRLLITLICGHSMTVLRNNFMPIKINDTNFMPIKISDTNLITSSFLLFKTLF